MSEHIPEIEEYVKRLNWYLQEHYPANKKITAEEWNALFLALMNQGNAQEDTLAQICNELLPIQVDAINDLIDVTTNHESRVTSLESTAINHGQHIIGLETLTQNHEQRLDHLELTAIDHGGHIEDLEDFYEALDAVVVKVIPQGLTEAQKAQARNNIGAAFANSTSVYVNNELKERIDFDSDPQTQIDNINDSIDNINDSIANINSSIDNINDSIEIIDEDISNLDINKQDKITDDNKLSSDYISDIDSINKFVTTDEKDTWNAKQGAISDLETIRNEAALGATALQPGDNISELINNLGFTKTEASNTNGNIKINNVETNVYSLPNDVLKEEDVVNNITSTQTNKPLSANIGKELQDQINNLKSRGRYLSIWNCVTGLAQTTPTVDPYTYRAGDYFIVGVVDKASQYLEYDSTNTYNLGDKCSYNNQYYICNTNNTTGAWDSTKWTLHTIINYKPNGATYSVSTPSTTVETEDVKVNDTYYYDGTYWTLLDIGQIENSFAGLGGSPYDNTNLANALNGKMDKASPTGTGSFSLNRKTGSNVGPNSFAEGYNATASGMYSHAEGYYTIASKDCSHAEGFHTTASGDYSHAEGYETTASGDYSHAEGYNTAASGAYSHAEGSDTTASNYAHAEGSHTIASGIGSHAEGYYTTAQRSYQHVFGQYNVLDTSGSTISKGSYVEIVGNGEDDNNRKNIRTLDWSGNERLKGTLYVGCNNDSTGGSEVATKSEIPTNTNQLTNGAGFITNNDITGKADKTNTVSNMSMSGNALQKTINGITSNVTTFGSNAFTSTTIPTSTDQLTNNRFVRYDVNNQNLTDTQKGNARTNIGAGTSNFSGDYNDLNNKPPIPTDTNDLTNGAGFITESDITGKLDKGATNTTTTTTTISCSLANALTLKRNSSSGGAFIDFAPASATQNWRVGASTTGLTGIYGTSTGTDNYFIINNNLTVSKKLASSSLRTYTFPEKSGTVALTSDVPSFGNGTITITQGGVQKGTFTTNQSGNTTIALDGVNITVSSSGVTDGTNTYNASNKLTGTKFSSNANFNTYIPYSESQGENTSPEYVASFIDNNGTNGLTFSSISSLRTKLNIPTVSVSAASGSLVLWTGTQAQYDAITTKSNTTLYFIKES